MKLSWGMGEVVVVLLSLAAYLFNVDYRYAFALFLLLTGAWTLVTGLFVAEKKDRTYYSAWGLVVGILSAYVFLPWNYVVGLVLVAIVALILLTAFNWRSGKMFTAATQTAPATSGETPAAS